MRIHGKGPFYGFVPRIAQHIHEMRRFDGLTFSQIVQPNGRTSEVHLKKHRHRKSGLIFCDDAIFSILDCEIILQTEL